MERHLSSAVLDGLTRRARSFISAHSIRIDVPPVGRLTEQWLALGVPPSEINRVEEYQKRWGGLALPPAPHYDGGPKYLDSDLPEGSPDGGWLYPAGTHRTATPYSFMIGPGGEFGVYGCRWTPLHRTVEGWVESVALAHHASMWAQHITKVTGEGVEGIALDGFEQVEEVNGMADTWWRGNDSLVALYTGEAECMSAPACRTALIYSGLDRWGLHGGVVHDGAESGP
jgi:hypothetical protein